MPMIDSWPTSCYYDPRKSKDQGERNALHSTLCTGHASTPQDGLQDNSNSPVLAPTFVCALSSQQGPIPSLYSWAGRCPLLPPSNPESRWLSQGPIQGSLLTLSLLPDYVPCIPPTPHDLAMRLQRVFIKRSGQYHQCLLVQWETALNLTQIIHWAI